MDLKSDSQTIVFVTGTTQLWGAERSLLAIAKGLAFETGLRPKLLTSNSALAAKWESEVGADVTLVDAPSNKFTRNFGFVRPIRRALQDVRATVIFDYYLLPAVCFSRICIRKRSPIVIDVHDSMEINPRRRPYFMLMRFATDGAICVSEYIARQVPRSLYPVVVHRPVADSGVVHPAAESPGRAMRAASDPLVVGVVGQISRHKKVFEAVKLMEGVRGNYTVSLRGTAPEQERNYLDEVLTYARRHLNAKFVYEGYIENDRVFDGLDILLFCNPNEPSGRVIAEAQLAGVVPVVPRRGGAAEFVKDAVTGYTFSSEAEGREVIERLGASSHLLALISNQARQDALGSYDARTQAQSYASAIRAVSKA